MVPLPYRVDRRQRVTADTYSLEVAPADAVSVVGFKPGQFCMLYAFGVGEVPISISGDPAVKDSLEFTVRSVGAVTEAICRLQAGATLGVRGPFGRGWPLADARGKDVLIIAGGLGLAPLRPAVYHLLRFRNQYDRLALLYGARTPADLLYQRHLSEWRHRSDMQFEATVDTGTADWWGHVGLVTRYIAQLRFNPSNSLAMVCGPEIMMRFSTNELMRMGIPTHMIFVSLERNMQCGTGACGHCQYGPFFVCKDGPVLPYNRIRGWLELREI